MKNNRIATFVRRIRAILNEVSNLPETSVRANEAWNMAAEADRFGESLAGEVKDIHGDLDDRPTERDIEQMITREVEDLDIEEQIENAIRELDVDGLVSEEVGDALERELTGAVEIGLEASGIAEEVKAVTDGVNHLDGVVEAQAAQIAALQEQVRTLLRFVPAAAQDLKEAANVEAAEVALKVE